jgi:hypothetical protein
MATPNPSRGIAYNFNAATFRNAIRFVFEMETDPDADNALTFHFEPTITYAGRGDSDKVPFDPAQAPTTIVPVPIRVPCDVTFTAASDTPTSFGTVIPAKVTVLLLDEDYAQVKDATYIVVNGDKYNRLFVPPSSGLFDVGLHEIVFQAENEM